MKLALSEAATLLGKSPRQVRYLIKTGRLEAEKDGGQWQIDSSALTLSDDQRQALEARSQAAREAFEKGLEPATKAAGEKAGYSVTDMTAFQAGQSIYTELRGLANSDEAAVRHLFTALASLTRGCHCFHPADKARRFTEARESAADAVTELLLHGDEEQRRDLARRVEQELIPKLAGLVASQEKRSRRHRFDRFGSSSQRDPR